MQNVGGERDARPDPDVSLAEVPLSAASSVLQVA